MKSAEIPSGVGYVLAGALLAGALLVAWWLRRPPADAREVVRRSWAAKGVQKPNVLLITLDTTRADHLGAYGYGDVETPNLDALARGGVLFAQAMSVAPLTLPAHSSIMTGTYPTYHGVRVNGNTALGPAADDARRDALEKGYATGAFIAAFVLDGRWGLNQGFDLYDDRFDLGKYKHLDLGSVQRPANEVVDAALAVARGAQAGPVLRLGPSLRPAHALRASGALPLEVRAARPARPLRRRDRVHRPAGGARPLVAEGQRAREQDRGRRDGRPRRGPGQPRRGDATATSCTTTRCTSPSSSRRRSTSCAGSGSTSQVSSVDVLPTLFELLGIDVPARVHGRSLLPVMLDPGRGLGGLRLRGVDDAEPPVRVELAPRPALDPLQADQGAPVPSSTTYRRSGRDDERLRTPPGRGRRPDAAAGPADGRDRRGGSGAGGGRPGQGDARAPRRARLRGRAGGVPAAPARRSRSPIPRTSCTSSPPSRRPAS